MATEPTINQATAREHGFSSPRAYCEFLRRHPEIKRWRLGRAIVASLADVLAAARVPTAPKTPADAPATASESP
jgi:hypothetical protein